MKSLRIIAGGIFGIFLSFSAGSQNIEIGAMAGVSGYYGDVANEVHLSNARYGFMGFIRSHIDRNWVLRANLGYVKILGQDSISSSSWQRQRNLNFYADIYELSGQVEYNLLPDKTRGRRIKNRTIPYVFAGLGFSYFVPQVDYNGVAYNLAALRTSGTEYSQLCLVMPMGVGVRHYITARWLIGFEAGMRFTSTSDLDDIRGWSVYPDPKALPNDMSRILYDRSTIARDPDTGYGAGIPGRNRGKIKDINDIYMIFGVTLSYKFNLVRGARGHGSAMRCPRFY